MDTPATVGCPLCFGTNISDFHSDKKRDYYHCTQCALVFIPPHQRLDKPQEKTIYDLHENDPADDGYQKFLSRLFFPLIERIATDSEGLDFGSGPGPALPRMFHSKGYKIKTFDPFYANNPDTLKKSYDFITCTEVVEHFFYPAREFDLLFSLLNPNGWLGLMTKLVKNRQAFATWHYKNDPTHVCFYSRQTFTWLAERYQCQLEFIGNDVILIGKK